MASRSDASLRWVAIVLGVIAVVVVAPFAPWAILAAWTAVFARPLHARLARAFGDRPRLAAVATVFLLSLVAVPVGALLVSLAIDTFAYVDDLLASERARDVLERVAGGDGTGPRKPPDLIALLVSQGERAWTVARDIAGATARATIGVFVLITGTYALLVEGERWYEWVKDHAPIAPGTLDRFAAAFRETGRGMFIGIFGAGVLQAILATGAYLVLGVPQALALGLLTLIVSVLPAIGTALVWVPVAAGLGYTGRPEAAIGLALFGVLVVGTVDNLVRPLLARRGHLQLPTFVVLLSMFGGVAALGAWGLVLGPLAVRLAKEAIVLHREARAPAAA